MPLLGYISALIALYQFFLRLSGHLILQFQVLLYGRNLFRMGFPGGSDYKESTCNAGDLGSIPGLGGSPGGGHGNPLQYSCLENSIDRGVVGYCPVDCKESDTTEVT